MSPVMGGECTRLPQRRCAPMALACVIRFWLLWVATEPQFPPQKHTIPQGRLMQRQRLPFVARKATRQHRGAVLGLEDTHLAMATLTRILRALAEATAQHGMRPPCAEQKKKEI